jgi:hypothetical protein
MQAEKARQRGRPGHCLEVLLLTGDEGADCFGMACRLFANDTANHSGRNSDVTPSLLGSSLVSGGGSTDSPRSRGGSTERVRCCRLQRVTMQVAGAHGAAACQSLARSW